VALWSWPLVLFIFPAIFVIILVILQVRKPKFILQNEWLVYGPAIKMPSTEIVMDRMLSNNPYSVRGQSPIGPMDGILFSDIRMNYAIALRTKNLHLFSSNYFENLSLSIEKSVAESESVIRITFISQTPVVHRNYLKFIAHTADAISEITNAKLIYDVISKRIFLSSELSEQLKSGSDFTEFHSQVRLIQNVDSFESLGLVKIGLREVRTMPLPTDLLVLGKQVMEHFLEKTWQDGKQLIDPIEAFGDHFIVRLKKQTKDFDIITIHRKSERN
jgi:hypothetical protein